MTLKDPQALLDYAFDWSPWLSDGETITSQTVTADAGLTVAPSGHPTGQASGLVTFWLAGGTAGDSYSVTCHVVTSQGREDDRTMRVSVQDR